MGGELSISHRPLGPGLGPQAGGVYMGVTWTLTSSSGMFS